MKVSVESEVFGKFPGFMAGLLAVRGLSNVEGSYRVEELLKEVSGFVRLNFTPERFATNQLLSAWQAALQKAGSVVHYRSDVQLLMERLLRGGKIRPVNKLVDLSRYVALKHVVPVSVMDVRLINSLVYGVAQGDEYTSKRLLAKTRPGSLILRDEVEVVAQWFGFRQSDKVLVNGKTVNALIRVEVLEPPVSALQLEVVLRDLADLVQAYCGGVISRGILNKEHPVVEL